MPLDAIYITALVAELSGRTAGCKVDKVQQPERDLFVLTLRTVSGAAQRLLISAGSGDSRIHLTTHKFDNPKEVYDETTKRLVEDDWLPKGPIYSTGCYVYLTGESIDEDYQISWGIENGNE